MARPKENDGSVAETGDSKPLSITKRSIVDVVAHKINKLAMARELDTPKDYSPANALKAAWLELQTTETKAKVPVLKACTNDSIANALLSMVIQGLTPAKKQVYFIAYGKKLVAQRSYFGSMAVAKRVNPKIADFAYQVIYDGDTIEFGIINGCRIITKHLQKFENINKNKIVAAYCNSIGYDGNIIDSVMMTMDEIKQSWKMSKASVINEATGEIHSGTTHQKFTAPMCERTVVNRLCKKIINTSSDWNILPQTAGRMDVESGMAAVDAVVEEQANKEPLVITLNEKEMNTTENIARKPQEPEQRDTTNPKETTFTFDDVMESPPSEESGEAKEDDIPDF